MSSFFFNQFIRLHPELSPAEQEKEARIISYNVKSHSPAVLQSMVVQALDNELQDYRIYSLSKRYNNLNLWAQYAGQHCGYCLEFANEGPLFVLAKDVVYLDSSEMEIPITDPGIKNGDFFFCKTREWAIEEEVRLVVPRGKGSKVKFDPRWLKRLILGKDMSEADRALIREWVKQREPELAVVNAYSDPVTRSIQLKE